MGLRLAGLVFYHVEDSGVNAMVEGHMQIRFVLLSFLCLYRSNAINDFGNLNTCNFLCLAWLLRLCTIILLYLIVWVDIILLITAEKSPCWFMMVWSW